MQVFVYDAKSSNKESVEIAFDGRCLLLGADKYDIDELQISARLGNMPRFISLPNSKVCECNDNDAIDAFLAANNRAKISRFVNLLESKLKYAMLALGVTILSGYLLFAYGMPFAAKQIADRLPEAMAYSLGTDTLKTLDGSILRPSKIPLARQEQLKKYFYAHLGASQNPKINVYFRSSDIGANAFALPDGSIVFTDELIGFAKNDSELLSIFFHELGHVKNRHAIRSVLQNSGAYVLIIALTGDVASAGSMLTAMPALLVQSGYSREMENEADDYALSRMQKFAIDGRYFADILERITKNEPDDKISVYLGSHPLTKERIAKFRGN